MSFFGGIIGTISKIAHVGYSIIKTALPILEALRPAVDEVDEAFDFIEAQISEGGVVADDWLDKNIDAIMGLEQVAGRGEAVFQKLGHVAGLLRIYSQEQTPDTITDVEAIALGKEILDFKNMLKSWSGQLDESLKLIKEANDD